MNKHFKTILIPTLLLLLVAAVFTYRHYHHRIRRHYVVSHADFRGDYRRTFADNNSVQLRAANKMGIEPMKNDSRINELVKEGRLVHLHSGQYYYTIASLPYLTPEAADLLAEIGRRYQNQVGSKWKRLRVTSMLRTEDYVKDLQKRNGNAVKNSCHLRGTTFDISYARMSDKEKKALAQVLADLRKEGYCYVMYEVNQPCFHITVRK